MHVVYINDRKYGPSWELWCPVCHLYMPLELNYNFRLQAVCTEAGMFALRERRVHVTQEDFEMAVAKVMKKDTEKNMSLRKLWKWRFNMYLSFHVPVLSFFFFCLTCDKIPQSHLPVSLTAEKEVHIYLGAVIFGRIFGTLCSKMLCEGGPASSNWNSYSPIHCGFPNICFMLYIGDAMAGRWIC